jgi:hypothetical protein
MLLLPPKQSPTTLSSPSLKDTKFYSYIKWNRLLIIPTVHVNTPHISCSQLLSFTVSESTLNLQLCMDCGFSELHKILHNSVNEVLQIQLHKPSCPFNTRLAQQWGNFSVFQLWRTDFWIWECRYKPHIKWNNKLPNGGSPNIAIGEIAYCFIFRRPQNWI